MMIVISLGQIIATVSPLWFFNELFLISVYLAYLSFRILLVQQIGLL